MLKELREAQKMTQAELAQKAGLTVATVSRIETGRHKPSPLTLQAIKRALKLNNEQAEALKAR